MSDQESEHDELEYHEPKSRRGQRLLKKKEAKLVENPRATLFIKGPKTSDNVRNLFTDLFQLKKNNSVMFGRKHDIWPFDSTEQIEAFCKKNECSLFCFASHSKKRPNNLILGRTFNEKILDMVELGVEDYTQPDYADINIPKNSVPLIVFNGDLFGYDRTFIKLHNFLTDFFVEDPDKSNIKEVNLVISLSSVDNKIILKTFQRTLNESGQQLKEIGPSCTFLVRREHFADEELFKKACKQPKVQKKNPKNVKYDKVGDKRGKVYVQQSDLSTLALKKRKKIKPNIPKTKEQ